MDEELFILISNNIKNIRISKGYSLMDLSLMTSMDIEYLNEIETNGVDGTITLDMLSTICTALNINILDLFKK